MTGLLYSFINPGRCPVHRAAGLSWQVHHASREIRLQTRSGMIIIILQQAADITIKLVFIEQEVIYEKSQ